MNNLHMNYFTLFPIFIGVFAVIQATLNRKMGSQMGLNTAVLINAAVFLGCASLVFFLSHFVFAQKIPEFMRLPDSFRFKMHAWYLLPGLFGFLLVLGLPLALSRISASQVFVLLVSTQILTSFIWDITVEKNSIPLLRLIGAALTFIGATLVSIR